MSRLLLLLLSQLVMVFALLGATCVVVTGQRGPTGPWVGEVGNGTQYPIAGAAVIGQVFDADNVPLGRVLVPTCPAYLAPGERGTFEVFTPPSAGRPPFRLEVEPRLGGFGGSQGELPDYISRYQSDGLSVRTLYRNAERRLVVAEVSNDSDFTYRYVDMCANLRDGSRRLLELASVDPYGGMPIVELAPGARRIFPMWFNELPEGNIEFVARGSLKHKLSTPSVAFNGFTVIKRDEVVDDSGQRMLRVVGEIDVSAFPDIGGLRLSAHVEGNYGARVDGIEAGCGGLADAATPAPVQFSIPLDSSALLRNVAVETILGTPGQNAHRLDVAGVTHQPGTDGSQLVRARIVNPTGVRAMVLGVCLELRDRSGELAGVTSVPLSYGQQYLAPGASVEFSGRVTPVGEVETADVVAFAHVPS